MTLPKTYTQMLSTLSEDGHYTLALVEKPMPTPTETQVLVKVEATPINPSDLGVMYGYSKALEATSTGEGKDRVLTIPVDPRMMPMVKARIGQPLSLGNEGAGTVVAAGSNEFAQSLIDKTVACMGGGMYGQYRCVEAMMCLPLNDGHTAIDGASSFVNPMTALSFLENMRMDDHTALVHTAAASNLGQMLNKLCQADGVEIVNIVRKPEQEKILQDLGAKYIVNSESDSFMADLTDAIHATGATLAFDATGGGRMADTILRAMEAAAARTPGAYSIYGSIKHKQVYLYGALEDGQTVLSRGYGMAWGVGGWLMPNFLARAGMEVSFKLRERVKAELTTSFASHYTHKISLPEALDAETMKKYHAKATGQKYLICPNK